MWGIWIAPIIPQAAWYQTVINPVDGKQLQCGWCSDVKLPRPCLVFNPLTAKRLSGH